MKGWGLTVTGVGAAMIAVSQSNVLSSLNFKFYGIPLPTVMDIAGVFFVIIGLLLLVLGLIKRAGQKTIEQAVYVYNVFDDFIDPVFKAKSASPNELKLIYRVASDLFRSGVSSIRDMKKWQDINPNIFWIIRKKEDGRDKIRGYFCVIPLKSSAAALVRTGEITGKDFTVDHILSPKSQPVNVYIGALAGSGFRVKGNVVKRLHHHIDSLKEKGARHAYARPVTSDGLRLCKKFGFECMEFDGNPKDKVHYLDLLLF